VDDAFEADDGKQATRHSGGGNYHQNDDPQKTPVAPTALPIEDGICRRRDHGGNKERDVRALDGVRWMTVLNGGRGLLDNEASIQLATSQGSDWLRFTASGETSAKLVSDQPLIDNSYGDSSY
jgi:hypothetical protein